MIYNLYLKLLTGLFLVGVNHLLMEVSPDIHICGFCKQQYNNFEVFLAHKQNGCQLQMSDISVTNTATIGKPFFYYLMTAYVYCFGMDGLHAFMELFCFEIAKSPCRSSLWRRLYKRVCQKLLRRRLKQRKS